MIGGRRRGDRRLREGGGEQKRKGGWGGGGKEWRDREWRHSGACSLDMDCHVHISSHCYKNSAIQEKKRIQESCWKGCLFEGVTDLWRFAFL